MENTVQFTQAAVRLICFICSFSPSFPFPVPHSSLSVYTQIWLRLR